MPVRPPESSGMSPAPRSAPISPWPTPSSDDDPPTGRAPFGRPVRIGLAGIWILLAIVTAVLRHCAERG